jgi:hypothetical protein
MTDVQWVAMTRKPKTRAGKKIKELSIYLFKQIWWMEKAKNYQAYEQCKRELQLLTDAKIIMCEDYNKFHSLIVDFVKI